MTGPDRDVDKIKATIAAAPAPGGVQVFPVRGFISARRAQALFVDAMAVVMEEWHARGVVEGRLRERERIARIICAEAALRRRDLALVLALEGDKPVDEALAELQAAPRPAEAVDEHRALLEQLVEALAPMRAESEGFAYFQASDAATFLCAITKAQLVAAREAITAAEHVLADFA